MEKAFTYMFKDNKFRTKALSYFVLLFICQLCSTYIQLKLPDFKDAQALKSIAPEQILQVLPLCTILFVVSMVISFIISGYKIACIRSLIEKKENLVLPTMNFVKNLGTGFKFSIASFLLGLAILSIVGIGAVIFILLFKFTPVSMQIPLIILAVILSIVAVFGTLFLAVLNYGFTWLFAKTDDIFSFFRFKELGELINKNVNNYILCILISVAITIGIGFIIGACSFMFTIPALFFPGDAARNISLGTNVILTSVFSTYLMFVFSYIIANCINKTYE